MEYKTTFEKCKSGLYGICSRCGGELEPIETVDNSGDPTFWQGCKACSCFDSGVKPETYRIAKELVENEFFRPYGHVDHNPNDNKEMKAHKLQTQISAACRIVTSVLRLHNQEVGGKMNTKILVDALKNIASMGKDGKCPGNCNAPRLAIEALVDYGNAKYKEDEEEKEGEGGI